MRKVFQSTFYKEGESKGDCLRSCIQTLTGIQDLPLYTNVERYEKLLEHNGWHVEYDSIPYLDQYVGVDGCFIGTGPAERGCWHAVIVDNKGDLVHDPHPSGKGLISLESITIIQKEPFY